MGSVVIPDTAITLNAVIDLCATVNMGGAAVVDTVKVFLVTANTANATNWPSIDLIAAIGTPLTAIAAIIAVVITNNAAKKLEFIKIYNDECKSFGESCGNYLGIASILSKALIDSSSKTVQEDDHYTDELVKELNVHKLKTLSHIDTDSEKICGLMDSLENIITKMTHKYKEGEEHQENIEKRRETLEKSALEMRSDFNELHSKLENDIREMAKKTEEGKEYETQKQENTVSKISTRLNETQSNLENKACEASKKLDDEMRNKKAEWDAIKVQFNKIHYDLRKDLIEHMQEKRRRLNPKPKKKVWFW